MSVRPALGALMIRVIACITQEHNPWLLLLAALICAVTSASAFLMLDRANARSRSLGQIWAVCAGLTAGLGVWATHFVAMTAYDVGLHLSFAPGPLFGSLAISLLVQTAAVFAAYRARDIRLKVLAGVVSGAGIITMHYVGMTGLLASALMQWDAVLVGASVFMALAFSAVAMAIFFASAHRLRALHAGVVLLIAICALHFTAMGALTLVPVGATAAPAGIAQSMLGVIVGFAALLLLIAALAAALADFYLSDRQRHENIRLRDTVAARTAELERLAQEQVELAATAAAANEAKTQFLANMSHELRTPLNAIIGFGELIKEDAADAQTGEDAQRIISAARHLLSLINDILDLSKVDAGRVDLEQVDFDAATLARETADTLRPLAAKNGVDLQLSIAADIGRGMSDAFKLKQCLLNLGSNAVKFAPDGQVKLSARRETRTGRDWLVFEVSDTGVGMTEEQIARLFQAFSQADPSVTRRFGGTGLGLVITKGLAQLMGGDVTVVSAPNAGSTFTLGVPADLSANSDAYRAAA